MKIRTKALITALWIVFSAGAAMLGKASALIPYGTTHSFYEHEANMGAIKFFLLFLSPMLLLIVVDFLLRQVAKR